MQINKMREILFRGFHPCEDGDTVIYVDGHAVKVKWVEGSAVINGREAYIHEDSGVATMSSADKIINPNFVGFYTWKVLPSTVGQYIGIKDKNGVKIFENDNCKVDGRAYPVTYGGYRDGIKTGNAYGNTIHRRTV